MPRTRSNSPATSRPRTRSSRHSRPRSRRPLLSCGHGRSARSRLLLVRVARRRIATTTGKAAMTDPRRPLHLAVMLGASAALYAGSMAGVALLQADADRALTQRQAPAKDAVSRLQDGHARLDAAIGKAADAYARAAARYEALTPTLTDTETSLSDLASRVETISGAERALPARISLPPITRVARTT